jgi:hypothetical protein
VTGDQIYIADHLLNTPANGSWTVTFVDINHFSLDGSTGVAAGGASGTAYRYSDLDLIDKSIQANAVPLAVSAETRSATEVDVSVTATVTVTGASFTDVQISVRATNALAELAASLPIGGQGTSGLLFLETIRRTIYDAVPGAINVTLTTPTADVAVAADGVVEFLSPTISVVRS